jgi:hypothetical protein
MADKVRDFWKFSDYGYAVAVGRSEDGFHVRFETDDGSKGRAWDSSAPWSGPFTKAIAEHLASTLPDRYLASRKNRTIAAEHDEQSGRPSYWTEFEKVGLAQRQRQSRQTPKPRS